jgi:hypothetical protein
MLRRPPLKMHKELTLVLWDRGAGGGAGHARRASRPTASWPGGQGFGGKLLGALIEESEQVGVPIYLETETEKNVRMYERLSFRLLNQITLPVLDLPMWEMAREPRT